MVESEFATVEDGGSQGSRVMIVGYHASRGKGGGKEESRVVI